MSEVSRLLKTSRLSALPKATRRSRGGKFPAQPIVETRANALARTEWGLKSPLPAKVDSRFITFNELDTMERLVDFQTNASFNWKRQRFQETGLIPDYETPRGNPLFFDSSKDTSRYITLSSLFNLTSSSSIEKINFVLDNVKNLRKEFQDWLLEKDPVALKNKNFNQNDLIGPAVEFLSQHRASIPADRVSRIRVMNKRHGKNIQATGGLSYGLKGRLSNSPNGVAQGYVGPGRFTSTGPTTRVVAFGGFTAEVSNSASNLQYNKSQSNGKSPRETVVPFKAEKATFRSDGGINIKTNVVVKHAVSNTNDGDFFQTQRKNLVDRNRASRAKSDTVQDLLALIKQNDRK